MSTVYVGFVIYTSLITFWGFFSCCFLTTGQMFPLPWRKNKMGRRKKEKAKSFSYIILRQFPWNKKQVGKVKRWWTQRKGGNGGPEMWTSAAPQRKSMHAVMLHVLTGACMSTADDHSQKMPSLIQAEFSAEQHCQKPKHRNRYIPSFLWFFFHLFSSLLVGQKKYQANK